MADNLFTLIETPLKYIQQYPQCLFVKSEDKLYFDNKEQALKVYTDKNSTVISFDTFFSSFEPRKWFNHCNNIERLFLELKVKGTFLLELIHDNGTTAIDHTFEGTYLLYKQKYNHQDYTTIIIPIDPFLIKQRNGILYAKLHINNPRDFSLKSYKIKAKLKEKPNKQVKFAIIIPTYNRLDFILEKINFFNKLLNDYPELSSKLKLIIVNNGQDIPYTIENSNIKIVKNNENVGGTGGFVRGIFEAEKNGFTHVIFMDDDATTIPESLLRIIRFYEYCWFKGVIGGAILKLEQPHKLIEFGAAYYGGFYLKGNSYKYNDLCNTFNLILICIEDYINYNAWVLACYPIEIFKKCGYPLPFFVHFDDIEYGLRITHKFNKPLITLLGIGSWHLSYYKRYFVNHFFYYISIRNRLITNLIYKIPFSLKNEWRGYYWGLLLYSYPQTICKLKAIKDILKGPSYVFKDHSYTFLEECKKLISDFKSFDSSKLNIFKFFENRKNRNKITFSKILKRIFFRITFNGHLLPPFLLEKGDTPINEGWGFDAITSKREEYIFGNEKMVYYEPSLHLGDYREINRRLFFKYLVLGMLTFLKFSLKKKKLEKEFQQVFNYYTSREFWEEYLGLADKKGG